MLPLEIVTEPSRLILTRHRPTNGGGKRIGNELQTFLILSLLNSGGNNFVYAFLALFFCELSVLYVRTVLLSLETIMLSIWIRRKKGDGDLLMVT